MININCSLPCFFENDGKCTLTHVISLSSTPHPKCIYFTPKDTYPKRQPFIHTMHNKTE
ncbi:MAG: hypothetical protein N4A64_08095 [Marinisporobacter sp.]|nr:hypothetical protein [Marinisporobacter sp.]